MKKNGKLELLEVLPRKDEVFVCEDPGRMDICGKPMDDVHIEVRRDHLQVWYFCYGCLLEDFSRVCFGAEMSMEDACKVIADLIPCCSSAEEQEEFYSEHPAPEEAPAENVSEASDPERQQIKEEVRQAYLNGGRTSYLYDIDGNEYYTTRDGVRHYTRQEG